MRKISQLAGRTSEAVTPKTLVELLGRTRVLVEHHKGILGYGTEEILVGASFGMICITGKDLRLCCMSREQLFVAGRIDGVRLEGQE